MNVLFQAVLVLVMLALIHVVPGQSRAYRWGLYFTTLGALATLMSLLFAPGVLNLTRCVFAGGLIVSAVDATWKFYMNVTDPDARHELNAIMGRRLLIAGAVLVVVFTVWYLTHR